MLCVCLCVCICETDRVFTGICFSNSKSEDPRIWQACVQWGPVRSLAVPSAPLLLFVQQQKSRTSTAELYCEYTQSVTLLSVCLWLFVLVKKCVGQQEDSLSCSHYVCVCVCVHACVSVCINLCVCTHVKGSLVSIFVQGAGFCKMRTLTFLLDFFHIWINGQSVNIFMCTKSSWLCWKSLLHSTYCV